MDIIEIYLNSKSADNYIDGVISNSIFNLPHIQITQKEKAYISVKNAVIPYSFYNINNYNNQLNYILNGIDYNITLEPGNYNVNTLKNHIIDLLFLEDSTLWTIVYLSSFNKYIVSNSTYDFSFKYTSTCFEILGFKDNMTYNSIDFSLKSTISINLFTIKNIYVTSNNFILNNIDSNNHNKSNIICSIPVSGVPNSILFYNDNTKHLVHNVNNLTSLNITLTDEDNNIIDLNHINYSITLEISITK